MIAPLSPTAAGLKLVDTASLELAHEAFCNADHDLVNLRKAYTVEAAALVNAELESRQHKFIQTSDKRGFKWADCTCGWRATAGYANEMHCRKSWEHHVSE